MSEASVNGFSGLDTESNQLDPEKGALAEATNCAIERPGVVFPRRGVTNAVSLTPYKRVYRMWEFGGQTMLHFDDGTATQKMGHIAGGVFTVFSGAFADPSGDANFRLHETQASDALFVATAAGIERFSAYSVLDGFAGIPAMPDMDRSNSTLGAAGSLMPTNTQRAYRVALVYRPTSGPERIGAPSGRLVLRNSTAGTVDPTIRCLLPVSVNTASTALTAGNWWLQLFSSDNSAGVDEDPGDEMALCSEYLLKTADITAGYVDVTDKSPYALDGSALYTNATQGTLGAAKEPPQHAMCLGRYRDSLVVANTVTRHYFELSILGVAGTGGIQDTDTLTIDVNGTAFTVTAKTAPAAAADYKLENTGAASQDIKLTAQNLCAAINRHVSNTTVYAFYSGIPGDPRTLGRLVIESRIVNSGNPIRPYVGTGDKRTCFEPQLPETSTDSAVQSTADDFGNGWAISEPSEPDAFPPFRTGRMGAGNIIWISSLEDACFFWHDSGEVWMMTGDPGFGADLGTLRVERKFTDLLLLAPFTARVVDNKVLALTDRGVVALSPSGYEVVSRPIDTELRSTLYTNGATRTRQRAFAVAHPTDRRYQLWLANPPTAATCYELNLRTNAWTKRSGANVGGLNAGFYSPANEVIYYADSVTGGSTAHTLSESDGQSRTTYNDNGETITATVTFPPFVVGDGTTPKQLREIQLAFESAQPATVTATVTTEHGAGSATAVTTQSTNLCRIPVPQSVQRGVRHTVSLSIAALNTKWALSAAKFIYRPYGDRGNK